MNRPQAIVLSLVGVFAGMMLRIRAFLFLGSGFVRKHTRRLAGLRGKDIVINVVESYGRSALTDPAMSSMST